MKLTITVTDRGAADKIADALALEVDECEETGHYETAEILQNAANQIYQQIGLS